MLITTKKPFAEVSDMLDPYRAVGIIGCANCCATCQTGGSEQVKEMVARLSDGNKEIAFTLSCEAPCDQRIMRRDIRRVSRELDKAEAILMLTCGIGLQSTARVSDKVLIPALNTEFAGSAARIGEFYEFCSACGDCVLGTTGGLCPLTLCPKGQLNGPCEGVVDGKCEAWGYQKECVWQQIYDVVTARGQLEKLQWDTPARDWSKLSSPRSIHREAVTP